MVGFLLLAETEVYQWPGHRCLYLAVLHLVYESAPPNKGLLQTGAMGGVALTRVAGS
jgi:hypothetical protein